jgi:hypothetical protein
MNEEEPSRRRGQNWGKEGRGIAITDEMTWITKETQEAQFTLLMKQRFSFKRGRIKKRKICATPEA